ncbi:hypothetical protein [Jejuia pallidilutea]|nr:hypothetical protein [Jejuia pallidilutea]
MKIETKYSGFNCTIYIDNSIVYRVTCNPNDQSKKSIFKQPKDYFFIQPKENTEFNYYKLHPKDIKADYKYNYKLEYKSQSDSIVSIPVKLNTRKLYGLKWQKKEFVIQDKKLKVGVLQYAIISLIGFGGFLIGRYYDDYMQSQFKKEDKKENIIENQIPVMTTANKTSNTESENKTDNIKGISSEIEDSLLRKE